MDISNKLLKKFVKYFKVINQLQLIIFNCYLQRDYQEKNYVYEENLHKARLKLFQALKKIRVATKEPDKNLSILENIYEIIFSLNTLKLRIKDHATFEVCEKELKKISESLSKTISYIITFLNNYGHPVDNNTHLMLDNSAKMLGDLSNKIDEMEELYRSTLQVVSPDPIFFLFFVQDLIALRDTLESFLLGLINE